IKRTWTVTDGCGHVASCVQTITVSDTHAPTFTCPQSLVLTCPAQTDPAHTDQPSNVADDCSGTTVGHSDELIPGNCAGNYTINRTWTVTDGCGHSSSCVQTIEVVDNTAPTFTCPGD